MSAVAIGIALKYFHCKQRRDHINRVREHCARMATAATMQYRKPQVLGGIGMDYRKLSFSIIGEDSSTTDGFYRLNAPSKDRLEITGQTNGLFDKRGVPYLVRYSLLKVKITQISVPEPDCE